MFESTTYNEAIEKGRTQGVAQGIAQGITQGIAQGELRGQRELVMALGRERLGEPSTQVVAQLESVTNPEQFPALIKRVVVAQSWNDVFAL